METMPDEEFNLLAALNALDTLDESERRALAEQLNASPELQSELATFEAAIAAIAYTTPPIPVAPDLKDRLFQRIAELPPNPVESADLEPIVADSIENNLPPFIVRSRDVKWKPFRVPGISIGNLYIDKQKREITCLMRLEAGVIFPPHRHAGPEEIVVLEGDLTVEGERCDRGDYVRSVPGSAHSPFTERGCLLLIKSSTDNEWLARSEVRST
ncbi:MAG: cupin-like domain-containing protein [Richelia sp. CSU_2_1]|nr:cupin-like domain-containing protein [Microcoleus sp. SU_5_6]NJL69744.1 cupin-like domain-containing protein [Microcoleus sp. SM1_3_4]NJR23828.1 cupin-like domain-containing protein [Richelia sp. CSU_2_1]